MEHVIILVFVFAALMTAIVTLAEGAEVLVGSAIIAAFLSLFFLEKRRQKKRDAQERKVVDEDQLRQQKKIEAEKDLRFLAKKLHKAPPYFESAYVRDGTPRWDTVGCNKAHFSREEILVCKLKSMSDEKQAEFIVKFR